MKTLLNVGGGSRDIALPRHYDGWQRVWLDIDPRVHPDVCLDARQMTQLPPGTYDAVYCSHNLEHFHRRDAAEVVRGFRHVLKPDGFAQVAVPNLGALFKLVVEKKLDLDDEIYTSPAGPIQVRDVIYGLHSQIEASSNDFYQHKTGYTAKSLWTLFTSNGFPHGYVGAREPVELVGVFFPQHPPADLLHSMGIATVATSQG